MDRFDIVGEYCDCKGGKPKSVPDILTGGHAGAIPAPKTISLVSRGGKMGGGETGQNRAKLVLAMVIVGVVVIIAIVFRKKKSEGFFTEYAQEEPTRSYTPYTGTIPNGPWGTKPWAEAYDLERPEDEYNYLPAGWRPHAMQLDDL